MVFAFVMFWFFALMAVVFTIAAIRQNMKQGDPKKAADAFWNGFTLVLLAIMLMAGCAQIAWG